MIITLTVRPHSEVEYSADELLVRFDETAVDRIYQTTERNWLLRANIGPNRVYLSLIDPTVMMMQRFIGPEATFNLLLK